MHCRILVLVLVGSLTACKPPSKPGAAQTNAAAQPAPAKIPGPNEDLFDSAYVPRLTITLAPDQAAALTADPRTFVRATIQENANTWEEVGVRLKGSVGGSFRPLTNKPSLTLNFDKFKKEQRFHGVDKLYLNNSVEDERYMTEALCGQVFRDAGIPSPRVTHARVIINGEDRGLYVVKEGWDKTFLKRWFKDPNGNLYESGLVQDVDEALHKNSGNESKDAPELQRAGAAAREPDLPKRWAQLQQVVDMDQFLTFMALEVMMVHNDGYALNKNNYRVYHNPESGKLVFMPHGMDIMFAFPDRPVLPLMSGLLARAVVEVPEGRQAYRAKVSQLLTNQLRKEILVDRINRLDAKIRPAVTDVGPDALKTYDLAVEGLRLAISRRLNVLAQLSAHTNVDLLSFSKDGVVPLPAWHPESDYGDNVLDVAPDGLHIQVGASGNCTASWRTNFLLGPGKYLFEGRGRSQQIVVKKDRKGAGAGLRASIGTEPRANELSGDKPWTLLQAPFEVTDTNNLAEVELICELRAQNGEVWFDLGSLRVVRLSP